MAPGSAGGAGSPNPLVQWVLAGQAPCTPADGDPSGCTDLIELVVLDVVPLTELETHAVVLTTVEGDRVLPIFVDEASAVAIAFRLAHISPPQPLAQDLLGSVVSELGAHVVEVRIDDVRNDIYFGRVFLQQGKKRMALDARPSDSIAMAMDGKARILVTRKVLDEVGIAREEIDALREGGPGVGGSGEPLLPPPEPEPAPGSEPIEL